MKKAFLLVVSFFVFQITGFSAFGMEKDSGFDGFQADRGIVARQINTGMTNTELMLLEYQRRVLVMQQSREESPSREEQALFKHYQQANETLSSILEGFKRLAEENKTLVEMDRTSYSSYLKGNPSSSIIDKKHAELIQKYVALQVQHQVMEFQETSELLNATQKKLLSTQRELIDALKKLSRMGQEKNTSPEGSAPRVVSPLSQPMEGDDESNEPVSMAHGREAAQEVALVHHRGTASFECVFRDFSPPQHQRFPVSIRPRGYQYIDLQTPFNMDMFLHIHRNRRLFQEGEKFVRPTSTEGVSFLDMEYYTNQRISLSLDGMIHVLKAEQDADLIFKTHKEDAEVEMLRTLLEFYQQFFAQRTVLLGRLKNSRGTQPKRALTFLKLDKSAAESDEIKEMATVFRNLIELLNDVQESHLEIRFPRDVEVSHVTGLSSIVVDKAVESGLKSVKESLSYNYQERLTNYSATLKRVIDSVTDTSTQATIKYLPSQYLLPMDYLRALEKELLALSSVGKSSFNQYFVTT